jgi:hypothetical protein
MTLKEKLLSRIIKQPTGCWEWQGATRGNGYGVMAFAGKKNLATHRMSYIAHNGDIPENLLVCHTCDNRKCINPDHLFLGTHSDNMKDALKKGRLFIPEGCFFTKGRKRKNRRLTDEEAKELKSFIGANYPALTLVEIAEIKKVPYNLVRDMRRKKVKIYL